MANNWQQKIYKEYPLVALLILAIVAGIVVALFEYGFFDNGSPDAEAEIVTDSATSTPKELKIKTPAVIPTDGSIELATSTPSGFDIAKDFEIKSGEKYVEFKETEDIKVVRVIFEGLTSSTDIHINFLSGKDIKIINSNNVTIIEKGKL